MILDDTVEKRFVPTRAVTDPEVQKEVDYINAGGLSPRMLQFLVDDANRISNQNKVEPILPQIETMTVRDLGEPPYQEPYGDTRKIANPHHPATDYYTVGDVYPPASLKWADKFK